MQVVAFGISGDIKATDSGPSVNTSPTAMMNSGLFYERLRTGIAKVFR